MGSKTIFLMLNFLLLILSINLISAQFDWSEYGNIFNPKWDSQYPDAYGRLNQDLRNISMVYGQTLITSDFSAQPLVAFINTSQDLYTYLIIQNGNYLQIYNKDLELESETLAGTLVSNLDSLFFTSDTTKRNIAGMYKYNSTFLQLKIFTYNHTTFNMSLSYIYNFSAIDTISVAGLRHYGNNILFNYDAPSKFVRVNESSGSNIIPLSFYIGGGRLYEPLAFADMDNDGNIEYMSFNPTKLYVWRDDGTLVYNYNGTIDDAKIFAPDGYVSTWKIAIAYSSHSIVEVVYTLNCGIIVKKLDGTTLWDKYFTYSESPDYSVGGIKGRLAITDDYNGDVKNDIFASYFFNRNFASQTFASIILLIRKGTDGTLLNQTSYVIGYVAPYFSNFSSLTIADIDSDGFDDYISSAEHGFQIYSPKKHINYIQDNTTSTKVVCIPADLNLDGFQEVICSGETKTIMFGSGLINNNSNIISVTFDPSTLLSINQTLNIIIQASDTEGNIIKYNEKCSNNASWGTETTGNIRNCVYNSVGIYNLTIGIKDDYHSFYNTYSQEITVTSTGSYCNNNGICEIGENYANCPNDCEIPPPQPPENYTQAEGGIAISTKIVDTVNTEQGLLPEIYYGTLGFLSFILYPMIVFVFLIFSVLIIMTIGTIIKKIANKVGN